jgi:hypothetical protein
MFRLTREIEREREREREGGREREREITVSNRSKYSSFAKDNFLSLWQQLCTMLCMQMFSQCKQMNLKC